MVTEMAAASGGFTRSYHFSREKERTDLKQLKLLKIPKENHLQNLIGYA